VHLRPLAHELSTGFRGTVLLSVRAAAEATDEEAFEVVVQWLEQLRAGNNAKLRRLKDWYAVAAGALGAEVLLWILTVAA
jgi:hypothetical protein